jgi:pimeloyl-ACP methyl ester carboxylesterase
MVYIWYPADVGRDAVPAPYIPHFAQVENAVGVASLKGDLGPAYDPIKSGRLRSHSVENARCHPSQRPYPVLVFSHGFGESSLTYASLLEDLASHGYIVAAIEHPYDCSSVVFPGGRTVPFAKAAWDAAKAKPDGAVRYQIAQIPTRAADIRFVVDKLGGSDGAAMPGAILRGHLDLRRLGVFGHSLGGMAAARACEDDARIGAVMNQDSDYEGVPFILSSPGRKITQPFLFFASGHSIYISKNQPPPTAEQLAQMKMSRPQYEAIIQRYQKNQDDALGRLSGGAYRLCAETPGFNHRSFIDTSLFNSGDKADLAQRLANMGIVRGYTRAFFDKYMRTAKDTLLDRDPPAKFGSKVRVDRFGRAAQLAR